MAIDRRSHAHEDAAVADLKALRQLVIQDPEAAESKISFIILRLLYASGLDEVAEELQYLSLLSR
jgi:hypothetical protein